MAVSCPILLEIPTCSREFPVQYDFRPQTHNTRNLHNHPRGHGEIATGFSEIVDNFQTFLLGEWAYKFHQTLLSFTVKQILWYVLFYFFLFFFNSPNWFHELPVSPDHKGKNTRTENTENASWPKKNKKQKMQITKMLAVRCLEMQHKTDLCRIDIHHIGSFIQSC